MRAGGDSSNGANPPTNRQWVQLLRTRQAQATHRDCGMFVVPKHPGDLADFASLQVVRLETFPGHLSYLHDDKERDRVAILFILGTHEATPETGTFSHACAPFRPSAVTAESGQPSSRMSTDECVYISLSP